MGILIHSPLIPKRFWISYRQLLKCDKTPEKGERQKSSRRGGVVISKGDQVCPGKLKIPSHLTGAGRALWSTRFIVSKGVSLIKRQPIKGTVACKVTVIRFSGDIIKHLAGERLNNQHTFCHCYSALQPEKEWWWRGTAQRVDEKERERRERRRRGAKR